MLATWKAGAAFICIDPAYPADRVHYMLNVWRVKEGGGGGVYTDHHLHHLFSLQDARAFTLLTQSKFDFLTKTGVAVINVDTYEEAFFAI